jgi:hypothetical protein
MFQKLDPITTLYILNYYNVQSEGLELLKYYQQYYYSTARTERNFTQEIPQTGLGWN